MTNNGIIDKNNIVDSNPKNINKIKIIGKDNMVDVNPEDVHNFNFRIIGDNNTIVIKKMSNIKENIITINLYGDNNFINIDENFYVSQNFNMLIGQNHPNFGKVKNSIFKIGKNVSMESVNYITFNSNCSCNIGDNCMFSYNIDLYNTDGHPIFDINTKKIINKVKGIEIGYHCWIGQGVSILKNSFVPNNSIIGWNAVYSGNKYKEENCSYAGNPAKICKKNIYWDSCGAKYGYIENLQEDI